MDALNELYEAVAGEISPLEQIAQIREQLPTSANKVINSLLKPIEEGAGAVAEYVAGETVEDAVARRVIYKLVNSMPFEDPDRIGDFMYFMFQLWDDAPTSTGVGAVDTDRWISFVQKKMRDYELIRPGEMEPPLDPDTIRNIENFTGRDMPFLYNKDAFMEFLYKYQGLAGLPQYFLSIPLQRMGGHYSMLVDRFERGLLPSWVDELGVKPAVAFIGDEDRSKIFNLESIGVLGFALVDAPPPAQSTSKHAFSYFQSQPAGTDKYGNEYKYNYFGPNNPIPNGDPINLLDRFAQLHDLGYGEGGYFNEEADRQFVDAIERAIADGRITESSPFDELKLARGALDYFSAVEHQ